MDKYCCFGPQFLIPLFLLAMVATPLRSEAEPGPGGILSKFRQSVFTVNAYSKVRPGISGKGNIAGKGLLGQSNSHWRRNVGTAFPVDAQGYLLTLNCVIRDADKIQVIGNGGERYNAMVVGYDETERISVLKIRRNKDIAVPLIRPLDTVKPGSRVVFLRTSPDGALSTVTGSVAAVNDPDCTIIVTVAGDPGTSGTPVFDELGNVIGLLAYYLEEDENSGIPMGKSYLVFPMEYMALVARSIINRSESRSGWLGIATSANELEIMEVVKGSPAELSGIRPGDRILEFNDSPVDTPEDLMRTIVSTRPGDDARIRILRGAETVAITVRLSAQPVTR